MAEVTTGVEPAVPSPVQAAAGIFVRPGHTFEAMRPRPRFVLPVLILAAAQILLVLLLMTSGAIESDSAAKAERQGATPDQIEHMQQILEAPLAKLIFPLGTALWLTFVLLLGSGLAFFVGNLMIGAGLTYRHYLSAIAHGSLIRVLDQAIQGAIALNQGSLDVRVGLGNLFGPDMGKLGSMLDSATDPFVLWSTAVGALGIAVYAKRGYGFGLLSILPWFVIGILMAAMRG